MNLGDIANKARTLTHSDTTSYPDATLLIDINLTYQKIVSMILESQDDSNFDDNRNTNYPIATRALIPNQRDYSFNTASWTLQGQEGASGLASQVLLPLKIKRLDLCYDGSNYYRGTEFDEGMPDWGFGNLINEDSNFIQQAPYYGFQYNSVFIYPMLAATQTSAALRLVLDRAVIPFSQSSDYASLTSGMMASTSVPGIDLPWHPMLALGAAYEFANANNLPQLQTWQQQLTDWEARVRIAYGHKDKDVLLYMKPAYDAYGDYGSTGAGGDYYGR